MKLKKSISMTLILSFMVSLISPFFSFAESSNLSNNDSINNNISEENDIYKQELIENVNIDGINYIYKYYYDENGDRSISITDKSRSKTKTLTYDEKNSTINLNGQKIGDVKEDNSDGQVLKAPRVNTSWRLINGPVHKYISWAKGTTTSAVAGGIALVLGFKTKAVVTALGFGTLGILASNCIGGTVHYSKYYRNLAFGQTQYRTDWSFVASSGDRYGTYRYLSTPQ